MENNNCLSQWKGRHIGVNFYACSLTLVGLFIFHVFDFDGSTSQGAS
jgi:hypothetical protein